MPPRAPLLAAAVLLLSACYSWVAIDLADAMRVVRPGDHVRSETTDGRKREFVVIAVTPPDLIAGVDHELRVPELVRLERRTLNAMGTAGAIATGAVVYVATATLIAGILLIAILS